MQRPDNLGLLFLLVFSGWIFALVSGVSSHYLARQVFLKSRFLTLKICVPPALLLLNVVLFLLVPLIIGQYYDRHYGYQLQPDEAPGPMGSESDMLLMLFLFFDIIVLCGYALYLVGLFFKWVWENTGVQRRELDRLPR